MSQKEKDEKNGKDIDHFSVSIEDTEEEKKKKLEAERLAEENEDLKNKLAIIADKELEKKKNIVALKAKELLKDPERVKEITDKLTTIENIRNMEFTLETLEKTLAKIEEEREKNKPKQVPSGTPLTPQQYPDYYNQISNQSNSIRNKKFQSYEEMITFLRGAHTSEADQILEELYRKGYRDLKSAGVTEQKFTPDESGEKKGDIPELHFDDMGRTPEENSELERLGVHKKSHKTRMKEDGKTRRS